MTFKKDEFLANEGNKQRFIDLLTKAGMDVFHAVADADSLIVKTAVELAQHKETCIIGDDTDLLIIAIDSVFKSEEINNLYILNEPRKTKNERIWPIQKLAVLGVVKYKHILFAHAFLGCDTTSALYSLGKPQAIKMLENEEFVCVANAFQFQTATRDEITIACEKWCLLT